MDGCSHSHRLGLCDWRRAFLVKHNSNGIHSCQIVKPKKKITRAFESNQINVFFLRGVLVLRPWAQNANETCISAPAFPIEIGSTKRDSFRYFRYF